MIYPKLLTGLVACAFLGTCSSQQTYTSGNLPAIEVETAFQNPVELSLTDLGETLTYIPLETNEASITDINPMTKVVVTHEFIFIGNSKASILCFDRKTGKFLRTIGRFGQGPNEYLNGSLEVDSEAKRIYVRNTPGNYVCFDFEGNALAPVTLPGEQNFMMGGHHFSHNKAYGYCNVANEKTTAEAYCYDLASGELLDSIPLTDMQAKKPRSIAPLRSQEVYGGMFMMVEHEDGTWTGGNYQNNTFWTSNHTLYHKDIFCDTIFQMKDLQRQEPVAAFQLGSLGGYGRYETSSSMTGRYVIPRILHNGKHMYFTLFTDLYDIQGMMKKLTSGGVVLSPSCGIYNQQTGTVKLQKESLLLKHPNEAMPDVYINTLATDGAWVGVYQTQELIEARENIPTEQQPDWLKNLKDDDNPVILLIEP